MDEKKRKRGKAALAIVAVLVVAAVGVGGFFVLNLLGKLNTTPSPPPIEDPDIVTEEEETAQFETLYDITDATNLQSFLYQWWHNGGDDMIRYSRNVVNILLVGVDDHSSTGRSDTMMLASVNKKAKTITLLSFLRDSYCYFNLDGKEYYNRINGSYFYGGTAGLMDTVSRLYKIRVDKYVTVDFQSFPALVDALGGVTVDVTEAEARYINYTAPSQNRQFPVGENAHLTGAQALIYSRIRKLDSDVERVSRQQKVIESIFQSARGANVKQLYNALETTLPYVETNYSRAELLGLVPTAIGWLDYSVVHMSTPVLTGDDRNGIGSRLNGNDVLIVDYPKAAQTVQMALYGESNIDLQDDGHRNAYIESLFRGARDRTTTTRYQASTNAPQSTADGEGGEWTAPDNTEATDPPLEETPTETAATTESRLPVWPFSGRQDDDDSDDA